MTTLTTPLLSLPYPDGAERVMDGDNAIGALAGAVDPLLIGAVQPWGAVASGTASANVPIAAGARLQLTALPIGGAATLTGNALVVARPGLYLVIGSGTAGPGAVGSNASLLLRQGSQTRAGASPGVMVGVSSRWETSALCICAANDELYLQAETAWNFFVLRFQMVRLGDAFRLGTLLASFDEMREADGMPPAGE
jgi:hypothetical protein